MEGRRCCYLVVYYWILFLQGIYAAEKIWICNTNADDKTNWITGGYLDNCTGFHFPVEFQDICLSSLRKITTNTIYLPVTGDVELREEADITLSEDSTRCVMVRDDIESRSYADPQCWKNDNRAMPDAERTPCNSDDVVFPEDATYEVSQTPFHQNAKSVTLRGEKIQTLGRLYQNDGGCSEFLASGYYFRDVNVCHTSLLYDYICNLRRSWRKIACSNPVPVKGHCSLFCGSVMTIQVHASSEIKRVFEYLTEDQAADAYYVNLADESDTYQITMTDRGEFTGESIFHAKKIYGKLESDPTYWGIKNIKANFSGFPITPEKDARYAMEVLFGTLFLVVLLFGAMFLVYTGPLQDTQIVPSAWRRRFGNGWRRTKRPFVFARFENRDDGTMSMGGSVVSLDKAFDNPMYGQQMASTSMGSSMQTVHEVEELEKDKVKGIVESEFSNPLHEEDEMSVEIVDD